MTRPRTSRRIRPRAKSGFHQWLGNSWACAVFASQGFHPGLHHRTRLHGAHQARVRQARREDPRHFGRSGRSPWQMGGRHQGNPGLCAELSDDRRSGPERRQGLGDAAGRGLGRCRQPHARRQSDRAQRVRHRARQEDQADPGLPDDHRTQFRRGAARDRFPAADRQAQGCDAGELEAGRGRDHRIARCPTTTPRRPIRRAGRRRKPYLRIVPQPKA